MRRMTGLHLWLTTACSLFLGLLPAGGSPRTALAEAVASPAPAGDNVSARAPETFAREGVLVEFSYEPADRKKGDNVVLEGEFADLRFRVTDQAKGEPVRSLRPGAWMDISKPMDAPVGQERPDCRKKVSLYLQGIVGIRPMLDLNGYYIVLMNREPNLYVIDPFVGLAGRTNVLATVRLREPGTDWVKSGDEKRIYVTLSKSGKVAAVETETFKLLSEADAGENPVRAALQPDGGLLWVGNDAPEGKEGGVTAIDPATMKRVGSVATGKGHHELAFSGDSRYLYATNRADGTVTVVDTRSREAVRRIGTGAVPISLAWSPLSQSLYAADAQSGTVFVVDGKRHEVVGKIVAKPGLGPMRFTPDGRWGLVLNSREDAVHIVDASSNRVAHTVPVGKEPYALALTRGFAHVRCLGTERVFMINLDLLGKDESPPVQSYGAGAEPPGDSPDLGIASGIASVTGQSEVLIVNPVNNTTYFYQDGMNFPSGNYPGYQQHPRAVETINRSLKETEPGVYTTRARVPVAGVYDVALFMDTPKFIHCFTLTAEANPALRKAEAAYEVEYLGKEARAPVGEPFAFRFRLKSTLTGWPVEGAQDARVLHYLSPGRFRTEVPAREVGEGVYEATLTFREPGAYYVYVGVPSRQIGYQTLPYKTVMAERKGPAAPPPPGGGEKGKEPVAPK